MPQERLRAVKILDWKALQLNPMNKRYSEYWMQGDSGLIVPRYNQISRQIGGEATNTMTSQISRSEANPNYLPTELSGWSELTSEQIQKKLENAKLYYIADYIHSNNGAEPIRYAILKAPNAENQHLYKSAWQWNTYFFIDKRKIEILD